MTGYTGGRLSMSEKRKLAMIAQCTALCVAGFISAVALMNHDSVRLVALAAASSWALTLGLARLAQQGVRLLSNG
jgi:hypothetical protein